MSTNPDTAGPAPAASTSGEKDGPSKTGPRRFWPKRPIRLLFITTLSIAGPAAAVNFGFYLYLSGGRFIATDNAYLKSDKIAVSADISGRVSHVAVAANDAVYPGKLLFRIDPEPFQIALDRAKAKLVSTKQEVEALRFLYRQKLATLKQAQSDIAFYTQQFDRQQLLNRKKIAAQVNFDTAEKNLRNARDLINVLTHDMAQVRAKLGGDPDIESTQHASVQEAYAAVKQAALDLKRTEIRSSVTGVITNFGLQPSEYIKTGDVIFSIVSTRDVWIEANYRETDLTHVRIGQDATIRIDAYPGREWPATVASISPATGSEFALLPPQNATGNWVKVVQRLPVRLKLKPMKDAPPLRAGMSALVEIDTHHKRKLSGFANAVVEWAQRFI